MKTKENSSRDVNFGTLQYGTIFRHDGFHYSKVYPRYGWTSQYIGLRLDNGLLLDFGYNTKVIYYPNAELSLNE